MTLSELRYEVLHAPDVQEALVELRARFVTDDLRTNRPDSPIDLDWNRLLLVASLLGGGDDEASTAAALRIAQGCFISGETAAAHRVAASVVLERMGNRYSVRLAERRELVTRERDLSHPYRSNST